MHHQDESISPLFAVNSQVCQVDRNSSLPSTAPAMTTPSNASAPTPFATTNGCKSDFSSAETAPVRRAFQWDVQPALAGRAQCGFVGLRNGGATCYMNAVLQQLFMQPGIPETLLSVTETEDLDEKNILVQTQKLFGHLLTSQLQFYSPESFWAAFRLWDQKNPVNPKEQQDAFDFFQALIDQLDEELKVSLTICLNQDLIK
ncbi:unnamed protein product [Protopolystoma xenopodis]|uniref:USP domain-containing protein n=1 Tax=Protopolystoma xenopodis TaxID=117903 RepID=A0A3S4ZK14_9PLAT|nr:unnamed protein product [Protopolystoma xenopodis]